MKFLGFLDQSKEIGIISRRLERVEAAVNAIDGAATTVTASAAIMHTEANKISAALQGERINAKLMQELYDSVEWLATAIKVMREFKEISQDLKHANAGVDRLLEKLG